MAILPRRKAGEPLRAASLVRAVLLPRNLLRPSPRTRPERHRHRCAMPEPRADPNQTPWRTPEPAAADPVDAGGERPVEATAVTPDSGTQPRRRDGARRNRRAPRPQCFSLATPDVPAEAQLRASRVEADNGQRRDPVPRCTWSGVSMFRNSGPSGPGHPVQIIGTT